MKLQLLLCFLLVMSASAQKKESMLKVTYLKTSNGSPVEGQGPTIVYAATDYTLIVPQPVPGKQKQLPFEQILIERPSLKQIQIAELKNGRMAFTADTTAIAAQKPELLPGEKTILGYRCRLAKTIINSNTIEFWYTDNAGFRGAPTILGQNLGLVLEMTRNGNFSITASTIEKVRSAPKPATGNPSQYVDLPTYRDIIWRNLFTTVSLFKKDTINFGNLPKMQDSVFHYANGTVIAKKVRFPEISPGSQIFIDLSQVSNGDAYDRTGTVFLMTGGEEGFLAALQKDVSVLPIYENGNGKKYQGVVASKGYVPTIELMRFFTPFGVGKYNTFKLKNRVWQDSAYYRQDISEFRRVLSGKEVWIGATIGNYDKGGHVVTANVTIHPEIQDTAKDLFVMPLFNTTNIMEMAGQEYGTMFNDPDGLVVEFMLEADIVDAKLRYTTTGHGGWENGDEFVQKRNTILLDGKTIHSFFPWRTDCGSYRNYNPASGNFGNGLSSSDYSRSNWCPGTVTTPEFIELGSLKKGTHTIQVLISQGANEGTSFSSWNVSGTLIGTMK